MSGQQTNSVFNALDQFRGYAPHQLKKDLGKGQTVPEDINNSPESEKEATSHTSMEEGGDMTPSIEATSAPQNNSSLDGNENPDNNSPTQEEGQKVEDNTTTDEVISKEEETYKKRYDDIKSHYDVKVNEFKDKISELESKLQDYEQAVKQGRFEPTRDINQFKENNPELFENIKSLIYSELKEYDEETKSVWKEIEERQKEIQHKTVEAEVAEAHPDAPMIKNSQEFSDWYYSQPDSVKGLLRKGATAQEIIKGLSLFKYDVNWNKTPKSPEQVQKEVTSQQSREAAASAVDTKSSANTGTEAASKGTERKWYESEIRQLMKKDPVEFQKRRQEIIKAQREGNYINDMLNR